MLSVNIRLTLNKTFLVLIFLHLVALASPRTFTFQRIPRAREKRHTPFLPGDYWKDNRPDFGSTETTISVMENATAKFKCPITHVADSSISFVRRRDFHILTNGHLVFTADPRFEISHSAKSHDWYLILRRVGHNDAGIYECQISTTSGIHALSFQLNVMTPQAKILGPLGPNSDLSGPQDEVHLVKGSTISLSCIVDKAPSPPQYFFWYLEERMVNYDDSSPTRNPRLGISVESGPEMKSTLTIRNAGSSDAGNYTCKPSNALPASVQVFVSEDRQSEPLLKNRGSSNDFAPSELDGVAGVACLPPSSSGCVSSASFPISATSSATSKTWAPQLIIILAFAVTLSFTFIVLTL